MKILYTEQALKEPNAGAWGSSQIQGALCPANLEPEFRLHPQSHGLSDLLTIDQLLTPVQVTGFNNFNNNKKFTRHHFV